MYYMASVDNNCTLCYFLKYTAFWKYGGEMMKVIHLFVFNYKNEEVGIC